MNRQALEKILNDPGSTEQERSAAQSALAQSKPLAAHQTLSDEARALLTMARKSHLRDVSEQDYAKFVSHARFTGRETVVKEYFSWHCPDTHLLDLLGITVRTYWTLVADTAETSDVREYALARAQA
jgi:hypothetical protein